MKPIALSIAILSLASLSGCAAFREGSHPVTQTSYSSEKDRQFWADQTWRKAISQQWMKEEQQLSRVRLGEFIP